MTDGLILSRQIVQDLQARGVREFKESDMYREKLLGIPTPDGGCAHVSSRLASIENRVVKVMVKALQKEVEDNLQEAPDRLSKIKTYYERECLIWVDIGKIHPCICPILGFVDDTQGHIFPGIITPEYQHGTLWFFTACQSRRLSIYAQLHIFQRIAITLEFLHEKGIAFRDLQAENIFVNDRYLPVLGNFVHSRIIQRPSRHSSRHIDAWLPPEYVIEDDSNKHGFNYQNPKPPGDIWSFGCLFYEIMTESRPYRYERLQERLKQGSGPSRSHCHVPLPDQLWDFLENSCWRKDPLERDTASGIKLKIAEFVDMAERLTDWKIPPPDRY